MAIPKQVFAHHVSYEDYNFGLVNFTRDMNDAITYGIDGFVLNTGSWSGNPLYQTIASTYYQAAMGTNFKLFFSLDMTGDLTEADILAMVALYYDHPNQYRINGVPVLSVWGGQASTFALTQSGWQTILAALVAQGTPVFFLPYIFPQQSPTSGGAIETPSQAQIALNLEECWSQIPIDGYFWPAGPPLPAFSASATPEFTTALHDAGVIYMAGVSPQYWGDGQTGQAGRRYTEFDGYEGFIAQWLSIINAGADLVEMFTWNDFNEATYVSPIDDPVKYWPEYNHPLGFYGTHVGFTALAQYFIEWYKTGVQPAIPGGVDNLYWCHRITPQAMVASDDPQGPVTAFTGDIADNVYITTNLVAPAQLVVNAGNGNQTYSVPEGLSSTRIPFVAPVIPTIALVRAGATVISTWTTQIVDSGTYYNFNYFTGTAIASATPVIASTLSTGTGKMSNRGSANPNGIDWDLLVQTCVRERAYETVSLQGASLQLYSGNPNVPPQIVRMMLYPHVMKSGRGLLHTESEGMSQKISHVGLCNYTTANIPNAPSTDIQFGDRITDSFGRMYRVEAAEDDGGVRNHMLLALLTISPNGDA